MGNRLVFSRRINRISVWPRKPSARCILLSFLLLISTLPLIPMNLSILGFHIHGIENYLFLYCPGFTKHVIKTLIKKREKGSLDFWATIYCWGQSQGRNLSAKLEHSSCIAFLYSPLHRDGATHSRLGPLTSISIQDISHRHPTGQSDVGNL